MMDSQLPLVDLRSTAAYQVGHYAFAAHLPWPALQDRLNELPERPASLQLLGSATVLQEASEFLIAKGYQIVSQMTDIEYEKTVQKQPGLVVLGLDSRPLWQPTPLLKTFIETLDDQTGRDLFGDDITPPLALDVGCGGGRDAVYLASQGWKVIAIDKEARVLQRAHQLAQSSHIRLPIDWRACAVESEGCLPTEKQDLVLMVRYLNRALLAKVDQLIKPGGYLLVQTFVEGVERFGSPKNPNFILKKGELAKTFAAFDIIVDRIDVLKDGRPVASFIAQMRRIPDVRNEFR